MRALELFSGSGSVGRVLRTQGWEVTSVDMVAKFAPDICVDVLKWDYRAEYAEGHFEYIHASPPCTEFSNALTTRPRNLDAGDALAQKALEIIAYFKPRYWSLENPDARLKTRPYMADLEPLMSRVSYCKYSEGDARFSYKKPTCVWTNIPFQPRPRCCKASPCEWLKDGSLLHPRSAQKAHSTKPHLRDKNTHRREELYGIPEGLVRAWVDAMG